jgi:hypothetical protein
MCIILFITAPHAALCAVEMSIVGSEFMDGFSVVEGKTEDFVSYFHFKDSINQTGYIIIIIISIIFVNVIHSWHFLPKGVDYQKM